MQMPISCATLINGVDKHTFQARSKQSRPETQADRDTAPHRERIMRIYSRAWQVMYCSSAIQATPATTLRGDTSNALED